MLGLQDFNDPALDGSRQMQSPSRNMVQPPSQLQQQPLEAIRTVIDLLFLIRQKDWKGLRLTSHKQMNPYILQRKIY